MKEFPRRDGLQKTKRFAICIYRIRRRTIRDDLNLRVTKDSRPPDFLPTSGENFQMPCLMVQWRTRAKAACFARVGAAFAASSPTRFSKAMREAVMKYSLRRASRLSPDAVLRMIFMGMCILDSNALVASSAPTNAGRKSFQAFMDKSDTRRSLFQIISVPSNSCSQGSSLPVSR